MVERIDAPPQPVLVGVDDQIEAEPRCRRVAKRDHLAEFPGGIDMQQRKRQRRGIERLPRQMQHDRGILADRIQHHRLAESAATSRMMWMLSASRRLKWVRRRRGCQCVGHRLPGGFQSRIDDLCRRDQSPTQPPRLSGRHDPCAQVGQRTRGIAGIDHQGSIADTKQPGNRTPIVIGHDHQGVSTGRRNKARAVHFTLFATGQFGKEPAFTGIGSTPRVVETAVVAPLAIPAREGSAPAPGFRGWSSTFLLVGKAEDQHATRSCVQGAAQPSAAASVSQTRPEASAVLISPASSMKRVGGRLLPRAFQTEIKRVDRDAVPTHARVRDRRHEAERLGCGGGHNVPHIDPHRGIENASIHWRGRCSRNGRCFRSA